MAESLGDFFKAKPKRKMRSSAKSHNDPGTADHAMPCKDSGFSERGEARADKGLSDIGAVLEGLCLDVKAPVENCTEQKSSETDAVALFWGDIKYFLEDMKRDILWMVSAAVQKAPGPLRGDEDDCQKLLELSKLVDGVDQGHYRKLYILWNSPAHMELSALVQCSCQHGRIILFPCPKSDYSWTQLQQAFTKYISRSCESGFVVPACPPRLKSSLLIKTAVLVTFFFRGDELYIFHIFNPSKRKQYWEFVGGDVSYSKDANYFDAVKREWDEEAGILLGFPGDLAFRFAMPRIRPHIGQVSKGFYLHIERGQPYLLALASNDFFARTRQGGQMEMPQDGRFVRWDDSTHVQKVHTDGWLFVENDEFMWIKERQFDAGSAGRGKDQRPIRDENKKMLQRRFESEWYLWAREEAK